MSYPEKLLFFFSVLNPMATVSIKFRFLFQPAFAFPGAQPPWVL